MKLTPFVLDDSNRSFQMISSQSQGMERAKTEGNKNGMTYEKTSEEETIPLKGVSGPMLRNDDGGCNVSITRRE